MVYQAAMWHQPGGWALGLEYTGGGYRWVDDVEGVDWVDDVGGVDGKERHVRARA